MEKGVYTIQVKATDCFGDSSDWTSKDISISRTKFYNIENYRALKKILNVFIFLENLII